MLLVESKEDIRCHQDLPTRVSRNSAIFKLAANVSADKIFKLFQEGMAESLSTVMNEISSDGRLHTYELFEKGHDGEYATQFNAENCVTTCSYKMSEPVGLLNCHALRVLNMKNIRKLPALHLEEMGKRGKKMGSI